MIKCKLADLNIRFDTEYEERIASLLYNYTEEFFQADIDFEVTKSQIEFEKKQFEGESKFLSDRLYCETAILRKIGEKLPDFDGAVLHSATFAVDGEGVAFGALSGTGKSTHMFKWRDMLGEQFQIINGDKPFVRFVNNELYTYGNPWAGKEGFQSNIKVPLKHVCQIVRSEINHTEPMSKQEGINLLLNQIYMPLDPMARIKTLQLINRIADSVTFWKISCNMDEDAAKTSYEAIFGGAYEKT